MLKQFQNWNKSALIKITMQLVPMLLILAHVSALKGVVETHESGITYRPNTYNEHISLLNVGVKPEKLYLRSGIDESAMVRWDVKNTLEDWSFEVKFNELNLNSTESAGLYIYYTQDKMVTGAFKGAHSIFKGIMMGIEFNGKAVKLVYSKNDGEDFAGIEEYKVLNDSINPERFRNLEEIKIKAIVTGKNIKLEVYDNENLLYDNFKFFDVDKEIKPRSGNYLAIIADYKNVSSSKAFILKEAQLFKREENSEYNAHETVMKALEPGTVRESHTIPHHNTDIQELIHKIETSSAFVRKFIGDLPNTHIATSEKEILRDLSHIEERINKLETYFDKITKKGNFSTRLNEFEIKVRKIYKTINEFDFILDNLSKKQTSNHHYLEYIILAAGCFGLFVIGAKELASIYNARNRNK